MKQYKRKPLGMFHMKHPQGIQKASQISRPQTQALNQQHSTVPRQRQMYRAVRD